MHTTVPDAHVEGKFNPPVMTTADLAVKFDPAYRAIAERFLANPDEYALAFAKAWYKLTHRDMGPRSRYLGDNVPADVLIWQDPIPAVEHDLIDERDVRRLKNEILGSGLSNAALVRAAWASASSFRASDMRGGANGGRLALAPQNGWAANNPAELEEVLKVLAEIREDFNDDSRRAKVSMADMVVLGGAAAVARAAEETGRDVEVPFVPGRGDATPAETDVASFALLEPKADAFRNYFNAEASYRSPTDMLVDKADQLTLTVPEMTVLLGGMRALGANYDGGTNGVLTDRPGTLSNDFFVNLMDMSISWRQADEDGIYEGVDAAGNVKYTATPVDLVFGSNSELRAIAEVYAYDGAADKFIDDFIAAWTKVMRLDRFDLN